MIRTGIIEGSYRGEFIEGNYRGELWRGEGWE